MPAAALSPDELLTTTRTVRKRLDLDRPVPMGLVRECLEIALQAPSGSNRQGWQWVVVDDVDVRARIGEIYRDVTRRYLESSGSAARLFAYDPERAPIHRRVGDSVAWLGEHLGDVPVLVIPCLRAEVTLPSGNQAGLWGSLLPAVWSYMLAARARGLGTAWTTLHLSREAEVADILGLPPEVHQGAPWCRRRITPARHSARPSGPRLTPCCMSTAGSDGGSGSWRKRRRREYRHTLEDGSLVPGPAHL